MLYFFEYNIYKFHRKSKYETNDLTLVTAYYRIKSKHSPEEYFKWINFNKVDK